MSTGRPVQIRIEGTTSAECEAAFAAIRIGLPSLVVNRRKNRQDAVHWYCAAVVGAPAPTSEDSAVITVQAEVVYDRPARTPRRAVGTAQHALPRGSK